MSMVAGIQGHLLEVTIVGCSRLKDTEWISRQDPYVCLEYATTKFRTRTCTDGGKHPVFQEKTNIPLIEGLREIVVSVWNSNTLTFDDFIGSGRVQLQKVLSQGYDDSSWPLQSKSGKFAGEVKLIMHYPNAQKAYKPAAASYAPAPTYMGTAAPYAPAPMYMGATVPYASPPIGYPPMKSVEAPPSYHRPIEAYPHTSSIPYPASSAPYPISDPTAPYPASSTYPTSDHTAPYPASSTYPTSDPTAPYPASSTYPPMTNYPPPQQMYPPPSYLPQTYPPQPQQHAYPPGPFPGIYPPPY